MISTNRQAGGTFRRGRFEDKMAKKVRFEAEGGMTSTAFITHRECWLHNMGDHHPECPDRLSAINDRLIAAGIDMYLGFYDAPVAELEQIARAHPMEHVKAMIANVPEHGIRHVDRIPQCVLIPCRPRCARRARGSSRRISS